MYSLPILVSCALLGLTQAATPTKRSTTLSIALSVANPVNSAADIKVTAVVTNTGTEALRLLKTNSILDTTPSKSFDVTKGGTPVNFIGVKYTTSLTSLSAAQIQDLAAGASVTVIHTLSSGVFDFQGAGLGTFVFNPETRVINVPSGLASPSYIIASPVTPASMTITAFMKRSALNGMRSTISEKRATVTCSTNLTQASQLNQAYNESKSLAQGAINYLTAHNQDALFTQYFGATAVSSVKNAFGGIYAENVSARQLSCSDPRTFCTGGILSYTDVANSNMYFCTPFFTQPATSTLCSSTTVASRNARGGTVLSASGYNLLNSVSETLGCNVDQSLASAEPTVAVKNIDNYLCFAEQVYKNTAC